jgi:hypothetical protein
MLIQADRPPLIRINRRHCIRQHTSAYVTAYVSRPAAAHPHSPTSLHTSAYVSIRMLIQADRPPLIRINRRHCMRQHTSAYVTAYVSIRQHTSLHTSAYVSIRQPSAYVSMRQHTSAYFSTRQHTSAYVSIRQHTSAYVSIRQHASD